MAARHTTTRREGAKEDETSPTFQGKKWPQFLAGFSAMFGSFTTGCMWGWNSWAIPMLREDGKMSVAALSWAASLALLSAAAGLIVMAAVIDLIGRKATMLGGMPFAVGGWILVAMVKNDRGILAGRFATGISGGMFCVAAPMYACEVVQKAIRGAVAFGYSIFFCLGLLYSHSLGLLNDYTVGTLGMLAPITIFVILFSFMPETPYFLLARGKEEKARKALQWLRGKTTNVEEELAFIKQEVGDAGRALSGGFPFCISLRALCSSRAARVALGLGLGLMVVLHGTGIAAIVSNAEDMFNEAGAGINGRFLAILIGAVQICGNAVSQAVMDSLGRRCMLLVSLGLQTVGLLCLGVYFHAKASGADVSAFKWAPPVALCADVTFFGLGSGPVPWGLLAEMMPMEAKVAGSVLCGVIQWVIAFSITLTYVPFRDVVGLAWVFWTFALLGVLCFAFVAFFIVETKRRTFTEIRAVLEGRDPKRAPIGLRPFSRKAEDAQ